MIDNSTPLSSQEYDANIENTVPFYSEFYKQTIDLVKSFHIYEGKWLDTGCGTGTFLFEVIKVFPLFQYVLCDPSKEMILQAKKKLAEVKTELTFRVCGSQQLKYNSEFDIITAIQSQHYLPFDDRVLATRRCYDALKENGVVIFFENFAPKSERSKSIVMERWGRYQKSHGKSDVKIRQHQQRYGTNYLPITLDEHFKLLSEAGYKTMDIFWLSYMQAGFYAIK